MSEKWDRVPLTPDEISRVIDATETEEEYFSMIFLADTGCRVNELIRMDISWFDFDVGMYGMLTIPPKTDANGVRGAKTKKAKHIPLTERLSAAARAYPDKRILRSSVWAYNVCKRCAIAAGIDKKLTPHVFRHSYARNAFYYGHLKTLEIAALLGHKDAKMVETVYLKIDDGITAKKLEQSGWLKNGTTTEI